MPNDISPIHQYFSKLDLASEIADIYLALNAFGPQSLLQLSRNAHIERTRLYRLMDEAIKVQLVEVDTLYKRNVYKAAPINNLQILLAKKEDELRSLNLELMELQKRYVTPSATSPVTHIQLYTGFEGIKQMLWNETRSKSENLSILYENMQHRTRLSFFERWVQRMNEQGIVCRSIVSQHFMETQKQWYTKNTNEKLLLWEGRYLPDSIMPILHSTITYDDVVGHYNWENGEIFGSEIHNEQIAASQRSIFEMLWQKAEPIIGHGEQQ